jgi:hypothetical protein
MNRTRQVIAVALVATALCADRVVAAAPSQPRVQGSSVAGRIVSNLSERFQRVLPAIKLYQHRRDEATPLVPPPRLINAVAVAHQPLTPFQFRLPPPVL